MVENSANDRQNKGNGKHPNHGIISHLCANCKFKFYNFKCSKFNKNWHWFANLVDNVMLAYTFLSMFAEELWDLVPLAF